MTFYEWIMEQTERQDQVGETARYVKQDPNWPKDQSTSLGLMDYFNMTGPHTTEERLALKEACFEYQDQADPIELFQDILNDVYGQGAVTVNDVATMFGLNG